MVKGAVKVSSDSLVGIDSLGDPLQYSRGWLLAASSQPVSKPTFYQSEETAPNTCQRVSKLHLKKLAESSLQCLSASLLLVSLSRNDPVPFA